MRGQRSIAAAAALMLALPLVLFARQNILKNGSMERGGGPNSIDPFVPANWTEFGINVERSAQYNLTPPGDGHALKAFGDGTSNTSGAFQEVSPVSPGQSLDVSVMLFTPANDKLGGSGSAGLVLEFLNQFGGTIAGGRFETYVLDASSPADTWIQAALGPLVAPANTAKVRVSCKLNWTPGDVSGAVWWDDAQLSINGGANQLLNADFETAGNSPGQSSVGIDDWVGFNDQEKSSDVAEHGTSSLKLGVREAYSGLYQDTRTLNAGDHLVMLAFGYIPSTDPLVGTTRAGIKLEFVAPTPPAEENLAFDENDPTDTWVLVELDTTVPADVTIARVVMVYAGNGQTSGAVYFDSAFAERGSAPGANQLANDSFEFGSGGANGIDDWTEFWSEGASQARQDCFFVAEDGLCSVRATGTAVAGIYQEISVTPGESLSIRARLLSHTFEPLAGTGRAGVKVEWFRGGVPDDVDIGVPNSSPNTIGPGAATNTWLPMMIDYTMPDGSSALARFTNIIEKGTAMTGRVYFDSCEAVVLNRFDGADSDGDDDQDLLDYAELQRCFNGSGGGLDWGCMVFDSDDDDDIDQTDSNFFFPRFIGPQ